MENQCYVQIRLAQRIAYLEPSGAGASTNERSTDLIPFDGARAVNRMLEGIVLFAQ